MTKTSFEENLGLKDLRIEGRKRLGKVVKTWEHDGIKFMILDMVWADRVKVLAPMLHDYYCGYCNLPTKLDYQVAESDVDVHGGITFQRDEPDGTFTYGFDCAHALDEINPSLRDLNFITEECESMAKQIMQLANEQ